MRSLSLTVVSFLLNQKIHLATAACTNTTTFLHTSLMVSGGYGPPPYLQEAKLDFISCPSSPNVSCNLTPKTYTLSVAPQFNISTTTNISFDDLDFKALHSLEYGSQVLDLPLNSSDGKAILDYALAHWHTTSDNYTFDLAISPVTFTKTTEDVSDWLETESFSYDSLTVEPGYNMTLSYVPFMSTTWMHFEQCERTLDGALIGIITPYYAYNGPKTNDTSPRGMFVVDKMPLNDVPDTDEKDSSSVDLKAGNGWATALIAFAVLALNWL